MSAPAKVITPSPLMSLPTVSAIFSALTETFKLRKRASQLKLSELVRDALGTGGVCVVEAPTGTGKTIGYLAGALDAYAHAGVQIPVVVATATVGLQEQIIREDIPRLAAIGAVDPRKVAVAKGRGRYFCPRTAALLEDRKAQDSQSDMFAPEKEVADGGVPIALDMLKNWRDKTWDGDRDSWPGTIPACWDASCGASSDTCVNRACEFFSDCPYMASRARLANAQLIIANHDMVLADLAQRADEQTGTALPPKSYAVVFDEAHNLPDKAIGTRQSRAKLSDTAWLRTLGAYGDNCLNTPKIAKALSRGAGFQPDIFSNGAIVLFHQMEELAQRVSTKLSFNAAGVHSWRLKAPGKNLLKETIDLSGKALGLVSALKVTQKAWADMAEESVGGDKAFAIRQLAKTHAFLRQAQELQNGFELFCSTDRMVRWASRSEDGQIALHAQPLEGEEVLQSLLWKAEMPVVMVSATLQVAGSFKRFASKTGLPGHAVTAALPPVFDYSRGYLHQPQMNNEPGQPGFEKELTEKIAILFRKQASPGMLALFTSRESMRRVVRALPDDVKKFALMQDHRPLPELVALHKERINRGERSMLVGLNSMAEGLDLPGKYCGHVVITRLPFAVPDDPVEEARRDHMGQAWFQEAYLADMLTMLIQACGRLIRREDDHGVITVLDRRLYARKYAALAAQALPLFTRGTKIQGYFDLAKDKGFDMTHGTRVASAPKLSVVPNTAAALSNPSTQASDKKLSTTAATPATAAPAAPTSATKATEPAKVESPSKQAKQPAHAASAKPESDVAYPEATLRRLATSPASTQDAVACTSETLHAALDRAMPYQRGPFDDHDVQYLTAGDAPCLPAGTPSLVWAERQMPQAVMLGLRLRNLPWDSNAPAWLQVLRLRPDLVQYAEILHAHRTGQSDARTTALTSVHCERQLDRALHSLDYPGETALFVALTEMQDEVAAILSDTHVLPRKDMLIEMTEVARTVAHSSWVVPF